MGLLFPICSWHTSKTLVWVFCVAWLLESSYCDRTYAECAYGIRGSVTMSKCHRWRIEVRVTRVTINVRSWKYGLVRRRRPKSTYKGLWKVGSSKVLLASIKSGCETSRGPSESTGCAPCCMLCVWCPLQHCAWCCLWCFVVPPVRLVTVIASIPHMVNAPYQLQEWMRIWVFCNVCCSLSVLRRVLQCVLKSDTKNQPGEWEVCDMTHSYVCHDSLMCVPCFIHMCDMTCSYVCHVSFIHVTWLFYIYDFEMVC